MKKSLLITFGGFFLIFCRAPLWSLNASGAQASWTNDAGWIPAQTFLMGDAVGNGRADARPVHPVTLSRYWMSPYLVTAAEYCTFLNESGWVKEDGTFIVSGGAAAEKGHAPDTLVNLPYAPIEKKGEKYVPKPDMEHRPMYYVTWEGAAYYCNWLSRNQGLTPCYQPKQNWVCDIFAGGYHLPTEAQWECAARGGNPAQIYPWGNQASPKLANYANHVGHITEVGGYPANQYRIHDLAGNVLEWCQDWYQFNYYAKCASGIQDPTGPHDLAGDAAAMRALRGGMYYDPLSYQTCSRRYGTSDTKDCFNFSGFRVVREAPEVVRDFAGMESSEKGSPEEMKETADWFTSHFQGRHVPFSFKLDGQPSTELLRHWKIARSEGPIQDGKRRYTITASDPKTGLEIKCETTRYTDFPAIDWVLHVTNRGSNDTPILENLRVLDGDFRKPKSEQREFILRHS
ncbi:MAG TPA: SUMF1/EgtB/PvdO family nonheme iron enzyme, partial [Verrucomicrobiae bacterium]|nr:SUMF1/EgtB/PvdO family nonheme iron enzyme [Verrucomicrobiae bacterium]